MLTRLLAACGLAFSILTQIHAQDAEYLTGIEWPEPPVITPGKTDNDAPSDAIILFDGKDLSKWNNGEKWEVRDGMAIVHDTDITTKDSFGDCQLHVEWSQPENIKGSSQGRGNSGVFLMDRYEMQVLDSYKNKTYFDGQAAGIYKDTPPMVNAMRPPGEWNNYDIFFTAPKFSADGKLEAPAFITATHNGVLVLNHHAIEGPTYYNKPHEYEPHGKAPIHLQNHGNPVRFRNIWIREIKPIVGKRTREPYYRDNNTKKEWPVKKESAAQ